MGLYASNKVLVIQTPPSPHLNLRGKVLRLNAIKKAHILDFILLTLPSQSSSLGSYYLMHVLNTYDAPGLCQAHGDETGQPAPKELGLQWEMSKSTVIT